MLSAASARRSPEILDGFRLRGQEVSRLESFADAVFGFALTLLVVSLDVPKNFGDLITTMRGFPAFALCFLILALIWNAHYKFCRRYGLDDGLTRFLTCTLLFLVLFYVYPLKFLFNLSVNEFVFGFSPSSVHVTVEEISTLLIIYGLGFAAVYLSIFLLYLHAWRVRDLLDLNDFECMETRFFLRRMAIFVLIGLLAAGLACSRRTLSYS
ncbi:MAG: TMEM175 family protein, partial [Bryobacteraceae bacterium]